MEFYLETISIVNGFGFGFPRNFWVLVSVSPKPKKWFRWITSFLREDFFKFDTIRNGFNWFLPLGTEKDGTISQATS